MTSTDIARRAVEHCGTTYAEDVGITLRVKPSPLWRLLVLSQLLPARISSDIAVGAVRELSRSRCRTPRGTVETSWQQRVDVAAQGRQETGSAEDPVPPRGSRAGP